MISAAPPVRLVIVDDGRPPRPSYLSRAQALWPRLGRVRFRHTVDDLTQIARQVARRTAIPPEAIVLILTGGPSASEPGACCPVRRSRATVGRRAER